MPRSPLPNMSVGLFAAAGVCVDAVEAEVPLLSSLPQAARKRPNAAAAPPPAAAGKEEAARGGPPAVDGGEEALSRRGIAVEPLECRRWLLPVVVIRHWV